MNEVIKPPLSEEFDDNNRLLLAIFIQNKELLNSYLQSNEYEQKRYDPVIKLLAMRCLGCAEAIARLLTFVHLEESVMLSRSLLETTINIGFINCADEQASEMMYEYTRQSIVREMDAMYEFAGTKLEVKSTSEYQLSDEIKETIDEFTTKSGKPIRDWTKREFGIEKRVNAVLKEFKGTFSQILPITFMSNYPDASELLHGSLHGVKKYLIGGIVKPDNDKIKDEALKNRTSLLLHHLQSVNVIIMALLEFTAKNCEKEVEAYKMASKSIVSAHDKIFPNLEGQN